MHDPHVGNEYDDIKVPGRRIRILALSPSDGVPVYISEVLAHPTLPERVGVKNYMNVRTLENGYRRAGK